jgi:CPA2 family monovalent cation:H+ antiporter-2
MHDISLITTIAFGFTAALVFGILAKRLGLSPIVGYLLAGIAAGPHTPGFVGNIAIAGQLAEIGVILLMFGVGLHFHLKDLLAVRSIAIPGALGQSAVATVASMLVAHLLGWSWMAGAVLGMATAVASTVVLLRVLMDNRCLETPSGHVAVGWLIVEDILTVLVLVVLPALAAAGLGGGEESAGGGSIKGVLVAGGLAVGKLLALGAVVTVVGSRLVPWMLLRVARLRSPELFTLAVLVMSIAVATAAYAVFGASMALGAFLAGMLVGQSKFSTQAGAEMLPLRDAFAVLFFVSVGMLFDFRVLLQEPMLTLGVVAVVLVAKPLIAFAIVIACRHTLRTALTVAGGLAQIGEFSFILAEAAKGLKLMPGEGQAVLVAAAIVSISVNPFLFKGLLALEPAIERSGLWRRFFAGRLKAHGEQLNSDAGRSDDIVDTVVIGYGPVGRTVTELLEKSGVKPLIIEMNVDTVAELSKQGRRALYGDATRRDVLDQAGLRKARSLIITVPDPAVRMGVIRSAREVNADIKIITRARYLAEHDSLREAGAAVVCCDEAGAATGLTRALLGELGRPQAEIDLHVRALRAGWGEPTS